jgi:hypothetical protein
MRILRLSTRRAEQLRRLRRSTWALIALCLFARGADAALGLNLIEHSETVAEAQACPISKESRI